MVDTKFIADLFPELEEIQDDNLKKLTVEAILKSAQEGGWNEQTIHDVPVTINWDVKCSLIEHVRTVTQMCIAEFAIMEKFYQRNHISFKRDYVVAGALLHDIGKFLEFAPDKDGGITHSEVAAYMRHPILGALVADRVGLPKELVHLIAAHSFEGDKSTQTAESDFVRQLICLFFTERYLAWKKKAHK